MPDDAQASMSDHVDDGPRLLVHKHPVDVLRYRLTVASGDLSEALDDTDSSGYEVEKQSLIFAQTATRGISAWLRWGMGERAGTFETDLNSVLAQLHSILDLLAQSSIEACQPEFDASLAQLDSLRRELDATAVEPQPEEEWHRQLAEIQDLLSDALRRIKSLCAAAERPGASTRELAKSAEVIWQKVIDPLRDRLSSTAGQLMYAFQAADLGFLPVHVLCDGLADSVSEIVNDREICSENCVEALNAACGLVSSLTRHAQAFARGSSFGRFGNSLASPARPGSPQRSVQLRERDLSINPYHELLRDFQEAIARYSGEDSFFLSAWTKEDLQSEYGRDLEKIADWLGCVSLPQGDVYHIYAPVRLSRFGKWGEPWREGYERFSKLAARAGAFLPTKVRESIPVEPAGPIAWWLAFMWMKNPPTEDDLRPLGTVGQDGVTMHCRVFSCDPFFDSCDLIERHLLSVEYARGNSKLADQTDSGVTDEAGGQGDVGKDVHQGPEAEPIAMTITEAITTINGALSADLTTKNYKAWMKEHGVKTYKRSEWGLAFGTEPPAVRGNVSFVESSSLMKALLTELRTRGAGMSDEEEMERIGKLMHGAHSRKQ